MARRRRKVGWIRILIRLNKKRKRNKAAKQRAQALHSRHVAKAQKQIWTEFEKEQRAAQKKTSKSTVDHNRPFLEITEKRNGKVTYSNNPNSPVVQPVYTQRGSAPAVEGHGRRSAGNNTKICGSTRTDDGTPCQRKGKCPYHGSGSSGRRKK